MNMPMPSIVSACEDMLNYSFVDKRLLLQALTHPSHASDRLKSYERLEFLGDAVVSIITSELLYQTFDLEPEGDLAKRRTALVQKESLAEVCRSLNLPQFIIISDGEENLGGRDNSSNLENMLEAILGAAYLDGGLEAAKKIILPILKQRMHASKTPPKDAKTSLQEWSQEQDKTTPTYSIVAQEGPSHAPVFTVSVEVMGHFFEAQGTSRKMAEQLAAQAAIDELIS